MTGGLGQEPTRTAAPPRKPPAADISPDEIDLLAYGATLWRYRYLLLVVTLVTAAITYAVSRQIAPTYEARFRLLASERAAEGATGTNPMMVAFRELAGSPTLVGGLLTEFKLSEPPHNLTVERFLGNHVDVEVIRDSTIIAVAVRLRDRELVVRVARSYAERIVHTAQRLNTEDIDFTAERIKAQRDAALTRLNGAENALQAKQRSTQIELLKKDVDTLLLRRPEALDLTVRIEGARARLQQAEAELTRHERVRNVRSGVDAVGTTRDTRRQETKPPQAVQGTDTKAPDAQRPDAQRPDAPRPDAPRPDARREGLQIRSDLLDPYVNPVYDAIARDVSEYRAEVAGLEQERKELVARLQLNSPTATKLSQLYAAEAEIAALTRDRDVARDAFLNAANQYESARLQSTIRSPRLQILDAALANDAPVAPRSLRNALAAALIALTLSALGAIVLDGSRHPAPA